MLMSLNFQHFRNLICFLIILIVKYSSLTEMKFHRDRKTLTRVQASPKFQGVHN